MDAPSGSSAQQGRTRRRKKTKKKRKKRNECAYKAVSVFASLNMGPYLSVVFNVLLSGSWLTFEQKVETSFIDEDEINDRTWTPAAETRGALNVPELIP